MAGTKAGGLKAAATNKKNNPNFYSDIGREGGKVKNPNKGFGTDNRTLMEKLMRKPKRAAAAGAKGGKVSKRKATV